MERKIVRIGNSLGITVPESTLEMIGVSHGDMVEIIVKDGALVIRNKKTTPQNEGLESLVRSVVENVLKEKGFN